MGDSGAGGLLRPCLAVGVEETCATVDANDVVVRIVSWLRQASQLYPGLGVGRRIQEYRFGASGT